MRIPDLAVVALLLGACQSATSTAHESQDSSRAPRSCKPEAPIAVGLSSRPLADGLHELTIRATPSATVDSIDLALIMPSGTSLTGKPRLSFGPTAAGTTRTLVATATTTTRTTLISAEARVPVEGIVMSRTASVTLGDLPAAPTHREYTLPDGERVREVRP